MDKAAFNAGLRDRTKQAREAARLTQEEIAKALGISQGTYKQYETRSVLPLHLIERFAIITRVDPWFLITGESRSLPKTKVEPTESHSLRFKTPKHHPEKF